MRRFRRFAGGEAGCYRLIMTTLSEIEAAADALPAEQKQELLLFLASRLRAGREGLPEPRRFSPERVASWVEQDEAEMRRFREGQ